MATDRFREPVGRDLDGGGLVIQGEADGHLRVFDARNGHELRNITTGLTMMAAPITYRVDGEQYIALVAAPDSGGEESTAPSGQVVASSWEEARCRDRCWQPPP